MIIEGNEKEIEAMEQFHKGNRQEGLRLQEEFAAAFREEYKDKDHCPCKKACRYQYKKPKNEFLLTFIILYEHLLYSL